ncbi:MAG: hypothetical protein QXY20_02170 [Thermofilum sp.]|uniref:hypothetical protein n=1 Tax=Thermofilum sp. TaxID=1961369 RepID=UPI003166432C
MQWKILLVALVFVVVLASALFFFVFKPKLPGLAQLAQNFSQPKPSLFTARIEAGQGGRVIVNGTETAAWSSTGPFTLKLEAKPGECHVFDHWLVNGTRLEGEMLSLTIKGNTTIKAVYKRFSYRLSVVSNASWGLLAVNGSVAKLPFEAEVPCGTTVRLALLPGSNETHSFTPSGFIINDSPMPGTETKLRVQGNLSVVAVYKVETHVLLIETNAPGVKVLVDGQEVTLPAKIQRARPFTVTIQAPPLVKVNDTFAWGSPEFQAQDYIRGVLTWVTFATDHTPIHVEEAEKTIRVYYHPYYSLGKDTYVTPLYGKAYVEGNTIVAEPDKYYVYTVNIILPPNWIKARVRVEASFSLGAVIMFPYNKDGNIYDGVYASVGAQRGACTKLTAEFEVVRNPPSARVLSYYCDAKIAPSQDYSQGPWNYGQGNQQYLGRLIVVSGDGSIVRIQVEVEG